MTNNSSIASEVVAACIGGAISSSALYPLEIIKTKAQASEKIQPESENEENNEEGERNTGTLSIAKSIYTRHGVKGFYHGVTTSAFQSATEKSLYFFAYTAFKNCYTSLISNELSTIPNLIVGCAAEFAHLPVTLPIDCWTTKIQTDTSNKGSYALLCTMLSEKGLGGMYKGIQAYTILCLKPSIQYTVFEQVKRMILITRSKNNPSHSMRKGSSQSLTALESFLLGMIARAIATIAVFPFIRAKVLLQSGSIKQRDNDGNQPDVFAMLLDMCRDGGVANLFQGLGPELSRGVLSAALMMMVKEKIAALVS